jgi:hypothetical protein
MQEYNNSESWHLDKESFVILDLPAHLTITKLSGDTTIRCHLCGKEVKLKDMRNHVGRHIIFALRGVDENIHLLPGAKV